MGNTSLERRYSPLIILLLVAALVTALGLWAADRAKIKPDDSQHSGTSASGEHFQWKMITTWPKNFPGLGMAALRRWSRVMAGGLRTLQPGAHGRR